MSRPSGGLTAVYLAPTSGARFNAIVFLYKNVLEIELAGIDAERAAKKKRLPVVLTVGQVGELFKGLTAEPTGLVVRLLYGCGLRVAETLSLGGILKPLMGTHCH